jgi:hypothetical protein
MVRTKQRNFNQEAHLQGTLCGHEESSYIVSWNTRPRKRRPTKRALFLHIVKHDCAVRKARCTVLHQHTVCLCLHRAVSMLRYVADMAKLLLKLQTSSAQSSTSVGRRQVVF